MIILTLEKSLEQFNCAFMTLFICSIIKYKYKIIQYNTWERNNWDQSKLEFPTQHIQTAPGYLQLRKSFCGFVQNIINNDTIDLVLYYVSLFITIMRFLNKMLKDWTPPPPPLLFTPSLLQNNKTKKPTTTGKIKTTTNFGVEEECLKLQVASWKVWDLSEQWNIIIKSRLEK